MTATHVQPFDVPASAPRRGLAAGLLVAGGLLSALNGAAHFVLPGMYSWAQHTQGLYDPVRWALYATTWFFALLLVLVGILVAAIGLAPRLPAWLTRLVVGGVALFWVVAAVYEVAVPFPDPAAGLALPIFSFVVAALLVAGLWLRSRQFSGK